MVELKAKLVTDAWVPASWEDYLQTIAALTYEKALQQSHETDQSQVGAWLMTQFQQTG